MQVVGAMKENKNLLSSRVYTVQNNQSLAGFRLKSFSTIGFIWFLKVRGCLTVWRLPKSALVAYVLTQIFTEQGNKSMSWGIMLQMKR